MSAREGQTAPSTINGHATGQSCPGAGGSMFPPGSQRARMISGRPYHQARDEVLVGQRRRSRPLIAKLEELPIDDEDNRLFVMSQLFGSIDKTSPPWIEHGFRTDFGCNTTFGSDVYINYDCTILDCGPITIGNRVLFAPRVQLLGATHPLHYELRNGTKGAEFGLPITIEDDVWLGAGCMILGGVTVGRGAVVGAGAVVVRDVEPLCVVAGSPARVLRRLPEHATEEEKAAHTVTD